MALSAFSFNRWIHEHKHLLKPPLGNQAVLREAEDLIVQVSGGANARTDYHDDPIREGEILLIPGHLRHSAQRPAGCVGRVVEKMRPLDVSYAGRRRCPACRHIHPGKG